ncbi:glycopeptide antibiotics resistance protein [Agromyces sp. 3263]|uniref:VanZ family protein n=1 Tax=Agromyces sp. 3263 TaxID=2817750 RepID=UPI002855C3F7|nr:VanZ family protein [Agromyces sp. 3263]MDR6906503.1 glycopeptide antibiotics resistance protein [Agromyces sp. 3263]
MNRRPLRFVALAYAAVVLWATVGPAPWRTSGNQLEGGILNPDAWTAPVTWTTGYLSEMAFNVAMFVPVGLLAALLVPRRRWPLALLAGFAFTAVIELVQVPEPDRISDPRDLVMNTGGAVLGVLLVLTARMVRRSVAVAAVPIRTPADDAMSSSGAATATDAPVPASFDAAASAGELVGSPSRIQ